MSVALVALGAVDTANLSPSFGQATTAHNFLVAWLASNDSGATDPFSTTSSGWNRAATGGTSFQWDSIWYKADCAASETAPVFSDAGGASVEISMLGEFSGVTTSSPLDSSGSSSTGDSTQTSTNAAPDAAAGDLIIFNAFWNSGNTGGTISNTMADSGGNTVTPNATNGVFNTTVYYDFVWGVAGATGANKDTATGTLSVFSNGGSSIASFKAASGPAAVPFRPMQLLPNIPVLQVFRSGWQNAGHSR
jgi:hypothetical protein